MDKKTNSSALTAYTTYEILTPEDYENIGEGNYEENKWYILEEDNEITELCLGKRRISSKILGNYYTVSQIDSKLSVKANAATTYTKTEVNNLLSSKADTSTTYTKTEVDSIKADLETSIATKADQTELTQVSGTLNTEINKKASKTYTDTELDKKQNTLVSGTDIKTINGESILASGNLRMALLVTLTQAQYDALTTKDANTLYIITDAN